MRRREFIAGTAVFAAAWSLAARAQQPPIPVIGVVRTTARGEQPQFDEAFRQGLAETGYIEGRNVAIEWRWAEDHFERFPNLLHDLVARRVSVIAVLGSSAAALAAKAATGAIPTVFMIGVDPVEFGLVASLAHPAGNMTGVAQLMTLVTAKRLDLLRQLVPTSVKFGLLTNPAQPFSQAERNVAEATARTLGLELYVVGAERQDDIDASMAKLISLGARAIIVGGDTLFLHRVGQIADLAARHAIPTVAQWREYPAAGGLMSYGNNIPEAFHLAGSYVGRILGGQNPSDMPVQQPTKFEFVLNRATAKSLGLEFPPTMLAVADEVIE